MSRVEDIRREAFQGLDLEIAAEWRRKALAWAGKLDDEQMRHTETLLRLQCTTDQVRMLEAAVRELEAGRHGEADIAAAVDRELDEARTRIEELEAEVAALRESDTVDVRPVDPSDEDAAQYPRVEWGGGECPVPGAVRVYVWLRDGTDNDDIGDPDPAGTYRWRHIDSIRHILAYRIAPDSEQTPEGLAALREYLRTHEPDGTVKADGDTGPPTGVWIPHTPGPCPYPERVGRVRFADGEESRPFCRLDDFNRSLWTHTDSDEVCHITHFWLKP